MSKSRAALVGAAGMKERNRGLSHETTAVASSLSKTSMIRRGSVPSGLMSPSRLSASDDGLGAAEVERDRVEGQPPAAVVEDEGGQLLVVDEHRIAHGVLSGSRP